ncbi:MAG TPA: bifunctional riboflavin kinase/FAD synthetase [Planctomycetota bacterium]|nr:bifunctional riboflavin kinase/FAD synthetase [Planctomycetota bacterium]
MEIIHGAHPLHLRRPIATLGTFDGVHLGHQRIIREVISWARPADGQAIVLTFATHPRSVTAGQPAEFITSLDHRLVLMERLGVNAVMVLEFDRALADTPAEEFIRKYFGELIKARGIVVGYNTRFGRNRSGDVHLLRELGAELGFDVRQVEPVSIDGRIVSSTAIRDQIRRGDLQHAARMLGRPASLMGTIVHGDGRGHALGFPTANLDLHHETRPPDGVYAGYTIIRGTTHKVLISIGSRPTFHAPLAPVVVEVYIDGFQSSIYGQDIEVRFITRLRDQERFTTADELIRAIRDDIERLRKMRIDDGMMRWG